MKRYLSMIGWMAGVAAACAGELPAAPARIPVESGVFESVAYDRATRELTLWFDNGAVYTYREVPDPVFTLFIAEPSKGRVYQQHIRGRFDSECRQTARRTPDGERVRATARACPRGVKGGAS